MSYFAFVFKRVKQWLKVSGKTVKHSFITVNIPADFDNGSGKTCS